ncbi:MAG TPA: hypothetical protein PKN29_11195, partial [Candidatus Ozemobacteraceae bacterium]|nr:hypothetical protein [Candidatus Ozemobacteraceae bacterium]
NFLGTQDQSNLYFEVYNDVWSKKIPPVTERVCSTPRTFPKEVPCKQTTKQDFDSAQDRSDFKIVMPISKFIPGSN